MIFKKKLFLLKIFSFQYGVSLKKLKNFSQYIGSNPTNIIFKLKRKHNIFVKQQFNLEHLNTLKSVMYKKLNFFWQIRLYRGVRHKFRLPSRGQRTHTNGKTKKKFKF